MCYPAEIQRRHHPIARTVTQRSCFEKKMPAKHRITKQNRDRFVCCRQRSCNCFLSLYSYHSLAAEDSPSSDKRPSDFASLVDPSGALSSLWQKQNLIIRKNNPPRLLRHTTNNIGHLRLALVVTTGTGLGSPVLGGVHLVTDQFLLSRLGHGVGVHLKISNCRWLHCQDPRCRRSFCNVLDRVQLDP